MAEAFIYDNVEEKRLEQAEGIEILVQMAKKGQLNPWNIDIIDVTDKYFAHLLEMKSQNLQTTSKTLLFASILLRLKSNILEGISIDDFGPEDVLEDDNYFDDDEVIEDYTPTNNVISFNEVLQRRTSVKVNRNRNVTLQDLIRQLEFYEKLDKKYSLKKASERAKRHVRSYANLTAEEYVNLTSETTFEKSIKAVHEKLEKIFIKNEKVELSELVTFGINKSVAFLSLLFLTRDGVCDLEQKEFYSDLYVVKANGTTEG